MREKSAPLSFFFSLSLFFCILLAGCTCPNIELDKYFRREDPVTTVRRFQLALDLGKWHEAAACLRPLSDGREISSFDLRWSSGQKLKELGGFSLWEVVSNIYEAELLQQGPKWAEVLVTSKPHEKEIQCWVIFLVRQEAGWAIDLDETLARNWPEEEGRQAPER